MGLFDFFKKKNKDENREYGNSVKEDPVYAKEASFYAKEDSVYAKEDSLYAKKDPLYVNEIKHVMCGAWHQYDVLLNLRGYGWSQMLEWADYVAGADLERVEELTAQDGQGTNNYTDEYGLWRNVRAIQALSMERGTLGIAGQSRVLGGPVKIVWLNQTSVLRIFTTFYDGIQIAKYVETLMRRTFRTPDQMMVYNANVRMGEIAPQTPELRQQGHSGQQGQLRQQGQQGHPRQQGHPEQQGQTRSIGNGFKLDSNLAAIASKLSAEDKGRIIKLVWNGEPVRAIKLCRDLTGAGLREAKDVVEGYQQYLMEGAEVVDGAITKDSAEGMDQSPENKCPQPRIGISFASKEYQDYLVSVAAWMSPEDREKVLDFVRQGVKIYAIKYVREITGVGLKEAKDFVDDCERYFSKAAQSKK